MEEENRLTDGEAELSRTGRDKLCKEALGSLSFLLPSRNKFRNPSLMVALRVKDGSFLKPRTMKLLSWPIRLLLKSIII